MASELKVDKFTGVTTAGSILVTGEGNSTTTNLQQGLAKQWTNVSANGETVNDSFNTSSVGDVTTGTQSINHANVFSNANYSCHITLGGNVNQQWIQDQATDSYVAKSYTGSVFSDKLQRHTSHGDLA